MEQGVGGNGIQVSKGSGLEPFYITAQFLFLFFGLRHGLAVVQHYQ